MKAIKRYSLPLLIFLRRRVFFIKYPHIDSTSAPV